MLEQAARCGERVTRTARVETSFYHCRAITRQRATNFYYALRLTPEPRRSAMYALYAVLRACDDSVDGEHARQSGDEGDAAEPNGRDNPDKVPRPWKRQLALAQFEHAFEATCAARDETELPAGAIWPAVWYVLHHYRIDPRLIRTMIQGQRHDLHGTAIRTFDDLYTYCYRVASTVGLLCIAVWGHDGHPCVHQLAEWRGVALQLTNILRDLREDAAAGRVYLPDDELRAFGCAPELWRSGVPGNIGAGFEKLMDFQIERARSYFEAASALERHIKPDCRATSQGITALYHGLLERIAEDPYRVLYERVRLSWAEKLRIASRAWWDHRSPIRAPGLLSE